MFNPESVTFGGSGLDRAAQLRSDPNALAKVQDDPAARMIVMWRGKPLMGGELGAQLVRLPLMHPIRHDCAADLTFLGLEESGAVFCADLSAWTPSEQDTTQVGAFVDPSEQRHPACDETQVFRELRGCMAHINERDAELTAMARALWSWHSTHGFCAKCGAKSVVVNAGWQRSCDACGGQHFPRTDPVVIMLVTYENSLLLGRSPGWPDGMYSLLAGFIEHGETIEAAVRREVFEETGITSAKVSYLASQPWPFPNSLMIGCHAQATSRELNVDKNELEDAIWVTREEVMQVMTGEHPSIKPSRKGSIARFLMENWLADRLG